MKSFLELNSPKRLEDLRAELQSGESLYFVGAGCSKGIGFPNWGELIKNMAEELTKGEVSFDSSDDYLEKANEIKKFLENKGKIQKYYSHLRCTFMEPPFNHKIGRDGCDDPEWTESKLHQLMFEFPVKAIVTTNYDHALEHYIKRYKNGKFNPSTIVPPSNDRIGTFLFNLKKSEMYQSIFHIHGDFNNPNNIILTKDDYNESYKTDSSNKKVLWTLLTTRCHIFIGFSLNDEYLNEVLEGAVEDVWSSPRDKHFAIFPYNEESHDVLTAKMNQFYKRYSIRTIFYNDKNNHEELITLFEWLVTEEEPKKTTDKESENKKPNIDFDQAEMSSRLKSMNMKAGEKNG